MPRKKIKFEFIENTTQRKASYKKRQKGFLKKAYELMTLCNAETSIVIYSPYHDEPKVFPNHDATINTFTKFRELSMLEKSNNMMTHEEFTKKRIKKMEKQLHKERKKNRIIELTNKMYEMLNGKGTPADMHSYDLNDLSYVINQNVKQVQEAIKTKVDVEGSTSNAPQHIDGLTVPEWRRDLLSAPAGAPVSMDSLMTTSSKILSGTNSEGTRALMSHLIVPVMASVSMVPPVALSMIPSTAPSQVAQSMSHLIVPVMASVSMVPSTAPSQVAQSMSHLIATCPQIVASEGPSWVSPSPHLPLSFSSQTFSPIVSQTHPPIPPLQIDLQRPPHGVAPSIPLSMMAPSINTPQISTSMPMNNYQNSSIDFPQNPGLSPDMLDWNNDDIMTLFDDSSFSIINVQEPNGDNNF